MRDSGCGYSDSGGVGLEGRAMGFAIMLPGMEQGKRIKGHSYVGGMRNKAPHCTCSRQPGCPSQGPRTGRLEHQRFISLKAGSPRSRCQQVWCLLGPLSLLGLKMATFLLCLLWSFLCAQASFMSLSVCLNFLFL